MGIAILNDRISIVGILVATMLLFLFLIPKRLRPASGAVGAVNASLVHSAIVAVASY